MRYSTVFKFIAVILCAASLLGMVASGAGILCLTELEGKSIDARYADQLENRALSYGIMAAQIHASEELGGASRGFIDRFYGHNWESQYFNWSRVGYTLYDGEGNVLREQPIPNGSLVVNHEFEFAVPAPYVKVLSAVPYEEYYPQATEPSRMEGAEVTVMPSQASTPVHYVIVDYSDGHRKEWPNEGLQLGSLHYDGGTAVTFRSNIGELPMGDGWYPNHILFADQGGNVVYEAYDDTLLIQGSSLDGSTGMIEWYLPAATVTAAAPVGITYTSGDYTSYDAIPDQGVTVSAMNVTYARPGEGDIGSEGITSPELIGTVFHISDGNVRFLSTEPMTMDIPEDCILTHISFADSRQNLIFEARCPGGVGTLEYAQDGCMVFAGAMPGTEVPEESVPQEIQEPETEILTAVTLEKVPMYASPSLEMPVMGTLEPGQQIFIETRFVVSGLSWGMITEGCWIPMEHVLVGADPAIIAEDAAPEETTGAEEARDLALPEETAAAEPEAQAAPDQADMETEAVTAAEEPAAEATLHGYPQEEIDTFHYYDGQDMIAEYVTESIPEGYTIQVRLAKGPMDDELVWTLLRLAEALEHLLLGALGICIAVFALCVVHLSCSAGRTRRTNEVRAGGLNRIPLDLYFGAGAFGVTGLAAAAIYGSAYFAKNDQELAILFCGACAYLICLALVGFFFAFVAQVKTSGGYWWRNSLCGRCVRLLVWCCRKLWSFCAKALPRTRSVLAGSWKLGKNSITWLWDTAKRLSRWAWTMAGKSLRWTTSRLARFFGMLPITWQFLTTGFALVVLLYIMMRTYKVGYILLGFGIFFAVILYAASAFAILLENAKRMSRGDLDTKVDDRLLIGGFKDFAGRLNDLADVAVIAAQKQLKSERMKTELITNVSHDIKTPLTSIINYVDLLRKPHTEQQQEQYLEVLDRQSQRLKKLIDDLMEMSKASTGNLAVEIGQVDACEAVNQALGEFADKLDRAQLMPVFRQPDDPVYMMADGRLVWRVMSNLLGNAVKYALPGTRIYLDLMEMEGKVIISMKNISREELNVNAEELMERFVRGDASRNTEGSGLGLNIARSLMELQKGKLEILVDGDLFKVTLIFPGA